MGVVTPITSVQANPPPPAHVTVPEEILNKMASHHVTINYVLIAVLVFVIGCAGVGAWFGLKGFDKLMQRAEASENLMLQYEQSWKQADAQYQRQAEEHAADRAQFASQIAAANAKEASLVQALREFNTKFDHSIEAILQPGRSAQEAFGDLRDAYKNTSVPVTLNVSSDPQTKEQLLTFPVTTVQNFTATKLDRDRLASNVDNLNEQLATKQVAVEGLTKTNASLTTDYNALKDADDKLKIANAQCQNTVKTYKAVAKKTKSQRIWSGMKTGGMVAVSLLAGYELGKHR